MGLTVEDYRDLIRLLHDNPELRAELRPLVLSDDLLRLPETMADLAQAQHRTETRVEELAEAQRRTEECVGRLEEAVAALAEAQRRTEEELRELAAIVKQLQVTTAKLDDRVARLEGYDLEHRYRERPYAFFGRLMRKVRQVRLDAIEDVLLAKLSREAYGDLLLADAVLRGIPHDMPSSAETYMALEVSLTLDRDDVTRAMRRAYALRQAGYAAMPVVAGPNLTGGAKELIDFHKVAYLEDGGSENWQHALEAWGPPASPAAVAEEPAAEPPAGE